MLFLKYCTFVDCTVRLVNAVQLLLMAQFDSVNAMVYILFAVGKIRNTIALF